MTTAVVFGGYGTFGSLVASELAGRGMTVTVAGRDAARAQAMARRLGPPHRAVRADVADPASCRSALAGQAVAACCAGPFGAIGESLLGACLEAGVHYADIADDRAYTRTVRAWDARFREAGLCAAYGCSSLPGLSGALALLAAEGAPARPAAARVTLFIGNDNPKGEAAVESLLLTLGRPIAAPQGTLRGFGDPETIPLPPPFGPRRAYTFESPEYDLFPELLGVSSVSVKVAFEQELVNRAFALLARLRVPLGRRAARLAAAVGSRAARRGSSGGAVLCELTLTGGERRAAALVADRDGQRMAALPCALAAHALATGSSPARGAQAAYQVLDPRLLLAATAKGAFRLLRDPDLAAESGL